MQLRQYWRSYAHVEWDEGEKNHQNHQHTGIVCFLKRILTFRIIVRVYLEPKCEEGQVLREEKSITRRTLRQRGKFPLRTCRIAPGERRMADS